MEEYLQDAIKNGNAFDAYKHPEIARNIAEKQIGFMRDVLSDIDERINEFVNLARESGVLYYSDYEFSILKWQMRVLPLYLNTLVDKFKEELENIKKAELERK